LGQKNPNNSKGKLECLDIQLSKSRVLTQVFYLRHSREANALVEVQIPGILELEAMLVAHGLWLCSFCPALILPTQRQIINVSRP
jgi:preprotein translocase subunit SecB